MKEGIVTIMFAHDLTLRNFPYSSGESFGSPASCPFALKADVSDLNLEIALAIHQSTTLMDLLVRCSQVLEHYLATASVGFWVMNSQTNLLTRQSVWGIELPEDTFPETVSLGISMIGLVGLNQHPYVTCKASDDICFRGAKAWLAEGEIQSFGGYPLLVGNNLVGVLTLLHREEVLPPKELLEGILPGLAAAIDRLELQKILNSHREGILLRLASHIRTSLDLDTILRVTVDDIREMMDIDRCNFLWCWSHTDPSNNEIQIILAITHEAKEEGLPSLLGECSASQTAALRDTMLKLKNWVVEDGDVDDSLDQGLRSVLSDWFVKSLLVVPVETRSGQLGAIICGNAHKSRCWSVAEIEVLQSVTDHVAIAMEQADLYAQTRATALAAQTQAQQLQEALKNLQQTQSQLVQSEKMSSLGQLVAGVAHEINNPVNFIAGNVQYAQDYVEDLMELVELYETHYPNPHPDIQEYIENIDLEFLKDDCTKMFKSMKMGTERIRNIVLSLRNFSRLDEAEVKPVDIHDGIDSTLVILENRTKSHGIYGTIQVGKVYGDLPLVECLAGQLNQVFMNILSNAIDAVHDQFEQHQRTEPGHITITTEAFTKRGYGYDPDWVRIRIQDDGAGIPDQVRKHIFDPFFTTKPVGQGTGLGLSISYQIITDKHKGSLLCESVQGQGTTFTIEIPVHLKTKS